VRGSPLVWRAGPHEVEEVARLLAAFRDHLGGERPSDQAMLESASVLIETPTTEYLLGALEDRTEPCGVAQLRYRHSVWTSAEDCWLEDLFVEAPARGRGLGRALALASCERAAERGALRIELDTNEANTAAVALYESLGFSAASKAHGAATGRDLFMGRPL
jgi:ribosomal protein S18 acetylase RimI-like enzyme